MAKDVEKGMDMDMCNQDVAVSMRGLGLNTDRQLVIEWVIGAGGWVTWRRDER
jgi:hypothetical protein